MIVGDRFSVMMNRYEVIEVRDTSAAYLCRNLDNGATVTWFERSLRDQPDFRRIDDD